MEQNCFETIQPYNLIEYKPKQQSYDLMSINLTIQANPILPEGKYKEQQNLLIQSNQNKNKVNKYTLNRKNQSLLPKIDQNNNQLVRTGRDQQRSQQKNAALNKKDEKQAEKTYEFEQYLKIEKLVYKKIENSDLNYISKNGSKFYCSIFLDLKFLTEFKTPINFYQEIQKKFCDNPLNYQDQFLKFSSDFQSGNLFSVYKKSQREYDLFMQNDINTKGCTQWFYFSIQNRKRIKIRLNILNFYKQSELYQRGMKPLIYSSERYKLFKQEWKRGGQSVQYHRFDISERHQFYKLSFTYQFEYEFDRVYFAYSYPYTYDDLRFYLNQINQNPGYKKILRRQILCKTLLNRDLQLYSITQNVNIKRKKEEEKLIIYIIARQHPGESPGSFVLEGFFNSLLSNRIEATQLRSKFIFKIIPMINIDGVICGNYRSNLSGFDVNRKWDSPNKLLQPEIWHLKQKLYQDKKNIEFFLDFHGHSRKMNSFFYGNYSQNQDIKIYPFICSKLNKNISKQDSSYLFESTKKSTARIVLQNQFNVRKSYTFQVSFYGSQNKNRRQHFQKLEYRQLGVSLLLGLYYSQIKFKQKFSSLAEALNIKNYEEDNLRKMQYLIQVLQKEDIKQLILNESPCTSINHQQKGGQKKIEEKAFNPIKTYRNRSMNINIQQLNFIQLKSAKNNKKKISSISNGIRYIEDFTNITFEKWVKQIQKTEDQNQKKVHSIGSDSDPEYFELTPEDFEQIKYLHQCREETIKQTKQTKQIKKQKQVVSRKITVYEKSDFRNKNLSKIQKRVVLRNQDQRLKNISQNKKKTQVREIKQIEKTKLHKKIEFTTQSNLKDKDFIRNIGTQMNLFSKRQKEYSTLRQQEVIDNAYNLSELKKTLKILVDKKEIKQDKSNKEFSQIFYDPSLKMPPKKYIKFQRTHRNLNQ